MEMKPEEIVRRYKMADNKGQIVRILSELNLCSQEQIREIIREAGIDVGTPGRKKKPTVTKKPQVKKVEVKEMPVVDQKPVVEEPKVIVPNVVVKLAETEMQRIEKELEEMQAYMIDLEHQRASIEVWLDTVRE